MSDIEWYIFTFLAAIVITFQLAGIVLVIAHTLGTIRRMRRRQRGFKE
jgi:hypothetical protein